MNCQQARESFPDLLDSRVVATEAGEAASHLAEARAHLASCPDCQREFSALNQTLAALDALPTPPASSQLRRNFYAMLEEEKHSAASVRAATDREQRRRRVVWWRWVLSPIAVCLLVGAGFFAGRRSPSEPSPTAAVADNDMRRQVQDMRAELDRMKTFNQLVAISLQSQQEPASKRLRGVLTSATQENPNDRVISELITSLALDSSANVRLRALEALYPHADQDVVRAGVLASLPRESNPLVQVSMIDFLAGARDHQAKPALERISASETSDMNVRAAAKRALTQL